MKRIIPQTDERNNPINANSIRVGKPAINTTELEVDTQSFLPENSKYDKLKRQVYSLLNPTASDVNRKSLVSSFIVILIILNVFSVIIETVESIYLSYQYFFRAFELFSIMVFSVEYLLRLWSCTTILKYSHPVKGRLRFLFTSGSVVDLAAIIPFYLPFLVALDLRFMRMLRLVRLFRFFKLGRYTNASKVISKVLSSKKEELIISLVLTFSLIIVASCVMYFAEHDAQPGRFSSIPETMWWSVATLTTVGYGDMYPITGLGKTLTAFISILGIGMFALPAGILASGFSEAFKKNKSEPMVCPHCGLGKDQPAGI